MTTDLRRRLPGTRARMRIHLQLGQLQALGPVGFARWHIILLDAWLRSTLNRRHYRILSPKQAMAARRSDTVFVFGSGYSLNDLTAHDWSRIEQHDIFGFSGFVHQRWVRVDFHLVRGWMETREGAFLWREHTPAYASLLNSNPHFRDSILLLQHEYLGQLSNQLVGYRLLRPGTSIVDYSTAREPGLPTRSFRDGLRHASGTLSDIVNAAYLLGWRKIVLTGVDLYDSRYFWLPPDKTLAIARVTGQFETAEHTNRGIRFDAVHNTARTGIVAEMGRWARDLEREGVWLGVYNPRSLLAEVMPVYDWNTDCS